jgi:hypothetical protein
MILSGTALGACEPKRIEIVRPPAALTECADEPAAPDLPGRDQQSERDRLTLDYILGLRSAWGDCRSKVDGIRAWSEALD